MARDESEAKSKPNNPRLVQSKLTGAFGAVKVSSKTSSDPPDHQAHGAKTQSRSTKPKDAKIDLYPSRRANLKAPPSLPSSKRSALLAAVAEETVNVLPGLLNNLPSAPASGQLFRPNTLVPAPRSTCPKLARTPIRVVNMDTLDAALDLGVLTTSMVATSSSPPVLVLNMANADHAGGGWIKGAIAQEEELCYRSSLPFTLKLRFYPMSETAAIYSPTVVILRESLGKGHRLLDLSKPENLPVVSVVSMAALRDPLVYRRYHDGQDRYANPDDRDRMKSKIRMILRVAAAKHHRKLVLGAFGCGAFGNPKFEVVELWEEVFAEREFNGGWWEDVVFAVLDNGASQTSNTNYGLFWRDLNGLEV